MNRGGSFVNVKIITDSAADLPKDLIEGYNIHMIPIRVYDEQENEYEDGVSLHPTDLFNNMRAGKAYKTSLPSYQATYDSFVDSARTNTPCIYIAFSSELSGTYQSSLLIKDEVKEQYPDFDITIIDAKCASLGQGLVVLQAAERAAQGFPKDELVSYVQFLSSHMEHIFTVDDLQYLVRGGRVGKVAGFIGGLLNIKPLLHVEEGKLVPIEKIRGSKKVLKRMVELVEERGWNLKEQTIGISHGDDEETALALKAMLEERFGCQSFVIHSIGAAIGAHAGPGTLAVFFLNEAE
jgi:DegV family protein with EDD domain